VAFGWVVGMSALLIRAMDDKLDRMLSAVVEVPTVSSGVSIPGTSESLMRGLEEEGCTVISLLKATDPLRQHGTVTYMDRHYVRSKSCKEIHLSFDWNITQMNLNILWHADSENPVDNFQTWMNTGITFDRLNAHGGSTQEYAMSIEAFSMIGESNEFEIESIQMTGSSIILKLNTRKQHAPMPGRPINMKTHPFALVIRYTLTFQR
jgi:hypothetical protein